MPDPEGIEDRLRDAESAMHLAAYPAWVSIPKAYLREAADTIAALREDLRIANERGDGWRAKFDADTTVLVAARSRIAELEVVLGEIAGVSVNGSHWSARWMRDRARSLVSPGEADK